MFGMKFLKQPFIQNSPIFKNEAGLFDEDKLKEYIATLKDNAGEDEQSNSQWLGWLEYERNIKSNLELNYILQFNQSRFRCYFKRR